MNRKALLGALVTFLALSLALGAVWVRQEGWVMRPAPTHWWWYALSAFVIGVNVGQMFEAWSRQRQLARSTRELREATARLQNGGTR